MMRRYLFIVLIAVIVSAVSLPLFVASATDFVLSVEEKDYLASISTETIKFATNGYLNRYVKNDGSVDGLLAPLLQILTDEWGLKVDVVNVTLEEAYKKLETKELDLFGLSILSEERKNNFYHTEQLYSSNMGIYTKKDNLISNVSDLKGKTIGLLSKSVLTNIIEVYTTSEGAVKNYSTVEALLSALVKEEIDCIATATAIQNELASYPELQFGMFVESVITPQGIYSGNEKYEALFGIINRYLSDGNGETLRAEIAKKEKDCIIDLFRNNYAKEINDLKSRYEEVIVFNSGGLYPLAFMENGTYNGLQSEINDIFYELTDIKINMQNIDELPNGIETAFERLNENMQYFAVTGVYYSKFIEENTTFVFSDPLISDKLSFYVPHNNEKKNLYDINAGTTKFGFDYMDWNIVFGREPRIYNTRDDVMKALKNGEIDAAFLGEMCVDYNYTILKDYSVEQFENISVPAKIHMLYNSKNESFNKLMDLSVMLNSMVNSNTQHIWTDMSKNGKFDLMRLRNQMENYQENTMSFATFFISVLALLLVIVIHQLQKFSEYDRQITKMLSTQGNVDMLWGNIREKKVNSKGAFPIFKKWGLPNNFYETFYNRDIVSGILKIITDEGLQFYKQEEKINIPGQKTPNYLELYTHKINEKDFMMFALDTTAERYREKELSKIANTDFLSKLLTRRAMDAVLLEKSENLMTEPIRVFVFMFDIDDFKNVNDSYGHDIGDKVLIVTSQLIKEVIGDNYASRWGGEEFLVLLEAESLDKAKEIAEEILQKLEKKEISVGTRYNFSVTISCGLTEMIEGEKYEDAIIRADKALYMAKSEGKNCIRTVTENDKLDKVFVYKKNRPDSTFVYDKVIRRVIKAFFYKTESKSMITELLEVIVENTAADCAALFEKNINSEIKCTYSHSNKNKSINTCFTEEWLQSDGELGEPMFVSDVSTLDSSVKIPEGLKAYVRLPIVINDEFRGFVQFCKFDSAYEWTIDERHVFTDISVITGEIIAKKSVENQLSIKNEALFATLDILDDFVYIIEKNTHKLLFVNKKIREKIGGIDVRGEKCWEVLHPDGEAKCAFCKNAKLDAESGITLIKDKNYNEFAGGLVNVKYQLVGWGNGTEAVIIICRGA